MKLQLFPDFLLMVIFLFLLTLIILTFTLYARLRSGFMKSRQDIYRYDEIVNKYITIIKCLSGDYTIEREFQEGDFIGKVVNSCPKCGNKLVIDGIYAIYARKK